MILKALDTDCGIITVNNLEDVYKIASLGVDETIESYSIEKENDLLTVTYKTTNDKELKFAIFDEDQDLGLSSKPTSFIYLGGHTKMDAIFTEGEAYPIVRKKEDGSTVLKGTDNKGYSIPQKFIDFYFEPSSEVSRYETIIDQRGVDTLEREEEQRRMDEMVDSQVPDEDIYSV